MTATRAHDWQGRAPCAAALARLVVEGIAALGTLLIGVLMVIICADIVARNVMGASLPLVSELGALLVVTLVALQLGATVRADRLARTEFLLERASQRRAPRAAPRCRPAFDLLGAAVLGGIAWATVGVLGKDWDALEFIGVPGIAHPADLAVPAADPARASPSRRSSSSRRLDRPAPRPPGRAA